MGCLWRPNDDALSGWPLVGPRAAVVRLNQRSHVDTGDRERLAIPQAHR